MENSKRSAYPINGHSEDREGLTKLEYFTAMAMQGLLANPNGVMTEESSHSFNPVKIAEYSIRHAKETLKQLEDGGK